MRPLTQATIRAGLLLALALLWSAAPAGAAEVVASAAIWRVSGPEVSLRLAFPRDAVRLLGQPGKPLPATEAVARQVLAQSAVEQDHTPCQAVDLGYDLGRIEPLYLGPALSGFEMQFRCPHAQGSLVLREQALSGLTAPHLDVAAIYLGAAAPVTVLAAGARGIELAAGKPAANSTLATYAGLGLVGLPGRLVCLATLGGLLLAVRQRAELIGLAAGVGAGYLAAGLMAAGGWVLARGPAAAFEGALVLFAAALVMGRATGELRKPALGLAAVAGLCVLVALLRGQTAIALALAGAGLAGASLLSLESTSPVCAVRLALAGFALAAADGFALPLAAAPLHTLVPLPAAAALGYNTGAASAALLALALVTALFLQSRRWLGARAHLLDTPLLTDLAATALAAVGAFQVLTV